MIAPTECQGCAGLMRCTSSGAITDRCVNKRNRNGFVSAPFCKPNGWYETPEEARARADYEQKLRAPLLAVRERFLAGQVQALATKPRPSVEKVSA